MLLSSQSTVKLMGKSMQLKDFNIKLAPISTVEMYKLQLKESLAA
jgi:hypothetical protein